MWVSFYKKKNSATENEFSISMKLVLKQTIDYTEENFGVFTHYALLVILKK